MQHPRPIDSLVEFRRQPLNFLVVEKTPAGQRAAQEQARIDGRNFRIEQPLPGFAADEVVQKSVLVLDILQCKVQCDPHAIAHRRILFPSPASRNAKRR